MNKYVYLLLIFCLAIVFNQCDSFFLNNANQNQNQNTYLNHHDTVNYVGMDKCLQCHSDKVTFLETGMGQSFGPATDKKSIINKIKNTFVFDTIFGFKYQAYLQNKQLYLKEEYIFKNRVQNTIVKKVDYVIGSGQHTNSHLCNRNGYVYQMPFTFYSQKGIMDLPPGFEHGYNTRFSRKIGLECMTCHNAYPVFVKGSENKYVSIPNGIDCERCHGPGEAHINQFYNGLRVDTSVAIDYTIVNPAKLSIERQFDICQRCHLQGNAVLKEGKSFLDFKPGKVLSDYITVFLPKYTNSDEDFIMASHADRLKQSKCFQVTAQRTNSNQSNSLKPYKNALTCVTCHNPHITVHKTDKDHFNKKCQSCHPTTKHNTETFLAVNNPQKYSEKNCIACHMPSSGSIDIPHVSIHDHFIRKPVSKNEINKLKQFIGLLPINQKKADVRSTIIAYLQQFEKFEPKGYYLDSAEILLKRVNEKKYFREYIWLYFAQNNFEAVKNFSDKLGKNFLLNELVNKSYDNYDAWTLYRLGESFAKLNDYVSAVIYFKKAVELAPYVLDFCYKLGNAYFNCKQIADAKRIFNEIIKQDYEFALAYNGLGYIAMVEGDFTTAQKMLEKAYALEPRNEIILLNFINLCYLKNEIKKMEGLINQLSNVNPRHIKLKALKRLVY
jgi:hypothetical protein